VSVLQHLRGNRGLVRNRGKSVINVGQNVTTEKEGGREGPLRAKARNCISRATCKRGRLGLVKFFLNRAPQKRKGAQKKLNQERRQVRLPIQLYLVSLKDAEKKKETSGKRKPTLITAKRISHETAKEGGGGEYDKKKASWKERASGKTRGLPTLS